MRTPPPIIVAPNGDPHWENVALLLHADGTNGSNTFFDSSRHNHILTAAGSAAISTTNPKYGTGAISLPTLNSRVSVQDAVLSLGNSDFTIEYWLLTSTNAAGIEYSQIVAIDNNSTAAYGGLFILADRVLGTYTGTSTWNIGIAYPQLSDGNWHHWALVRKGPDLTMYCDGQSVGTQYIGTNGISPAAPGWFSAGLGGGQGTFPCKIDELRITKGVARYSENFIPPIKAFSEPDYTGQVGPDVVLLHFETGIDGNSRFTEQYGNTVTWYGSTTFGWYQHSPSKKFGAYGVCLQPACGVKCPPYKFMHDFTIEFWLATGGGSGTFLNISNTLKLYDSGDHSVTVRNSAGAQLAKSTNVVIDGIVKHFAVTRRDSMLYVYHNGILVVSVDVGTGPIGDGVTNLTIGDYNGNIDELRIDAKNCRYSGNQSFTPPAVAFAR